MVYSKGDCDQYESGGEEGILYDWHPAPETSHVRKEETSAARRIIAGHSTLKEREKLLKNKKGARLVLNKAKAKQFLDKYFNEK